MDRWVVLEPCDTLAVRDGRAFDAGIQWVAQATLPRPSTVAGAIGKAFGAAAGAGADPARRGVAVPEEVRGPVTVRFVGDRWRALWPMPRDVVFDEHGNDWRRLAPDSALDQVQHDLGELRLLGGEGDTRAGWWPGSRMAAYLRGEPTSLAPAPEEPWRVERRVGLVRTAARTAAEGMLYAAEHLRPAGRVGLAVLCVNAPRRELARTVRLGGEGRRAWVHAEPAVGDGLFPPCLEDFPEGRLMLVLATPAAFAQGWRPEDADLMGGRLVAAAVSGPEPVAMGRPSHDTGGISHTRLVWMAAAGSVYRLKFANSAAAAAAARAWHGAALPQVDQTLRTAGFGLALVGRW